jgi:lysophospholipase L1-like esterase
MTDFIKLLCLLFISNTIFAQENPKWDDTKSKDWPEECNQVEILSTIDGKIQPAYFYKSKSIKPSPLIVSLHTWSGGFDQKDTLSWQCIEKDYNYIHPHFRGPNYNYEACGSPLAIQDIDDAIEYAIQNGNVDTNEIHIIGTSGGGYATMLMYMKTEHPVKTFSAWVGISDLTKWYQESIGRDNKYALDMAKSTSGKDNLTKERYYLDKQEAKKRSPYYMSTPTKKRQGSKLNLYAGIHDGYTGSVPITQSLLFYNKIVRDFDINESNAVIPENDIIELLSSRNYNAAHKETIGNRMVHYEKTYLDKAKITIFEGGHEMLSDVALSHVNSRKILTLGDSNGAAENGWVNQLRWIRFNDVIYNESKSGRTIGFYNLGDTMLNALVNIEKFLTNAEKNLIRVDDIIIMLGTNDCKAIFDEQLTIVPKNLDSMIKKIKAHPFYLANKPRIHIVSPPPYGSDKNMLEKYHGGAERIAYLFPRFKEIANKNNCNFIDVYSKLLLNWDYYAKDGIHPITEGQIIIANTISSAID